MDLDNVLTTKEAADALGVTPRRVRALIADGRLPAKKHGNAWAIRRADLENVRDRRPGRPTKDVKSLPEPASLIHPE